jgi:hypothetical protein
LIDIHTIYARLRCAFSAKIWKNAMIEPGPRREKSSQALQQARTKCGAAGGL